MTARLPLGIYRHYKGNRYKVPGVATHSETREKLVVYQALYADYSIWVRPLDMFVGFVEVNGVRQKRFTLITENTDNQE